VAAVIAGALACAPAASAKDVTITCFDGTLQLSASSSLYDLQRSAGAVTFNDIDMTMPLGDPVAAASSAKAKAMHRKKSHKHQR
jgi:hypothetical protein